MSEAAPAREPRPARAPRPARETHPAREPRSARDGADRVVGTAFGAGAVVFTALAAPSALDQQGVFHPAWSVAAVAVVTLLPAALGVLSLLGRLRAAAVLARLVAIGYLLVVATVPVAVVGAGLPAGPAGPWVFGLTAVGTSAAALVMRWPWVLVVVAGVSVGVTVGGALVHPSAAEALPTAVQDGVYAVAFDLLFASFVLLARRSAAQVDAAAADELVAAAAAASADARRAERVRVSALVHDRVLGTLLVAAQAPEGLAHASAADARRAIRDIDELVTADAPSRPVSGRDLAWTLQADLTELAPTAEFSHDVVAAPDLPARLATAVREATREALRNSQKHADVPGRSVGRALHVEVRADGSGAVTVLDDGRGFVVGGTRSDRLGLSQGIRETVSAQPGARVVVVSRPDVGTRVQIDWRAP